MKRLNILTFIKHLFFGYFEIVDAILHLYQSIHSEILTLKTIIFVVYLITFLKGYVAICYKYVSTVFSSQYWNYEQYVSYCSQLCKKKNRMKGACSHWCYTRTLEVPIREHLKKTRESTTTTKTKTIDSSSSSSSKSFDLLQTYTY